MPTASILCLNPRNPSSESRGLVSHDDLDNFVDVEICDGSIAIEVNVLQVELRRCVATFGVDHLHDVRSIDNTVVIGPFTGV